MYCVKTKHKLPLFTTHKCILFSVILVLFEVVTTSQFSHEKNLICLSVPRKGNEVKSIAFASCSDRARSSMCFASWEAACENQGCQASVRRLEA